MDDLLRGMLRNLIVVSGLFWLFVTPIVTAQWSSEQILRMLACLFAVGLLCLLAHRLSAASYRSALVVWLAGMFTAIFAGAWLLANPNLLFAATVLPLLAVITAGGWAGIAVELVLALLLWLGSQWGWSAAWSENQAVLLLVVAAFCALLGGVARAELRQMVHWSLIYIEDAQAKLAAMREQRLELEQSRADLIHVNRELKRLSERLKVMEHIAEEARQAKTEFVANVSHELRTPAQHDHRLCRYYRPFAACLRWPAAPFPAHRHRRHSPQCGTPVGAGQRCARPEPGGGGPHGVKPRLDRAACCDCRRHHRGLRPVFLARPLSARRDCTGVA